jgi:hypothetical protein
MTHQDDSPLGAEVHALAQSLLDSAASDAPSPLLRDNVAGAIGLSGGAAASLAQGAHIAPSAATAAQASVEASSLGAGTSTSATVAGGAKLGTAASALGGSLKVAPLLALGKWVAGGFVIASVTVGTVHVAQRDNAPAMGTGLGQRAGGPSLRGIQTDRTALARKAEQSAPEAQGLAPMQPAAGSGSAVDPALCRESMRRASTAPAPAIANPEQASGAEVTRAFGPAGEEPPDVPWTRPSTTTPNVGVGSFPPAQPSRSVANAPNDQLAGEVELLDRARASVASGRLGPALAALDQYHARYPGGVLRAEALALTVDAWLRARNEAQARRWVQVLERSFPTSQHLERFSRLRAGSKDKGGAGP